jgi:hypothetical protein
MRELEEWEWVFEGGFAAFHKMLYVASTGAE